MDKWVEIRTAYQVAKLGTVSAAAQSLGIHRATVNRHIDALEAHLGTKLFQRHGRGYVLTETGEAFLAVATRTEEMLGDFVGRIRAGQSELTGEIIVTTLPPLAGLLMPPIRDFRAKHAKTRVVLLTQDELLKLEYGEAHVAVRTGRRPEQDDYVVQRFLDLPLAPYASEAYIRRKGLPKDDGDLSGHDFIGVPGIKAHSPVEAWLSQAVPPEQIVLKTSDPRISQDAVSAGIGIGFLPVPYAGLTPDLKQVWPAREDWSVPLWLVTHVDLHRTEKVQAMLSCIKEGPGRYGG
jgi:DNA-binding transcriptional LysR family regulator